METKVVTIHKFKCTRCDRKATSVIEKRAKSGLCRICRAKNIISGQLDINGNTVV